MRKYARAPEVRSLKRREHPGAERVRDQTIPRADLKNGRFRCRAKPIPLQLTRARRRLQEGRRAHRSGLTAGSA